MTVLMAKAMVLLVIFACAIKAAEPSLRIQVVVDCKDPAVADQASATFAKYLTQLGKVVIVTKDPEFIVKCQIGRFVDPESHEVLVYSFGTTLVTRLENLIFLRGLLSDANLQTYIQRAGDSETQLYLSARGDPPNEMESSISEITSDMDQKVFPRLREEAKEFHSLYKTGH